MQFNILLFAAAKEAAGTESIQIDVPCNSGQSTATAQNVIDALGKSSPALLPLLPSCRLAIDNEYVSEDAVVSHDCEIALIPPVSGG